jgi:hypothetical protein
MNSPVTHGFSCARICSSGELDVQHLLKLLVAYNFLYGSPQKALHNLKTALSARSAKAWRAASGTAAKQRYGGVLLDRKSIHRVSSYTSPRIQQSFHYLLDLLSVPLSFLSIASPIFLHLHIS